MIIYKSPQKGHYSLLYILILTFTNNYLEPEIYIFKPYRNKGYGTRVLKKFIDIAFTEGLVKKWIEKNDNSPSVYSFKKENVFSGKLVSTVRAENEISRKMMLACGFRENKKAVAEFLLFLDDESSVIGFEITKDEYLKIR